MLGRPGGCNTEPIPPAITDESGPHQLGTRAAEGEWISCGLSSR